MLLMCGFAIASRLKDVDSTDVVEISMTSQLSFPRYSPRQSTTQEIYTSKILYFYIKDYFVSSYHISLVLFCNTGKVYICNESQERET